MKRIALLLAGAVLGTGCIIDSDHCERTLTVDWLFVDYVGNANLNCTDAGVNNVDVWIDGVLEASAVPCTTYGVTRSGFDSGSHDVVVEGYQDNTIINRDWYTLPATCSDAAFHSSPGEGTLNVLPLACEAFTTYLTYDLYDRTAGASISAVLPTDVPKPYTCDLGTSIRVPYGTYDLLKMEETNAAGDVVYAAKCTPTPADVLTWGTTTVDVELPATATGCSW